MAFTDDQWLLCFSKNYANENDSEGFEQGSDATSLYFLKANYRFA